MIQTSDIWRLDDDPSYIDKLISQRFDTFEDRIVTAFSEKFQEITEKLVSTFSQKHSDAYFDRPPSLPPMDISFPHPRSPGIDANAAGPNVAARSQSSILFKRRPRKESGLPRRRQRAELDRMVSITETRSPVLLVTKGH